MAYLDLSILNDYQAKEAINVKRDKNFGMLDASIDSTRGVDYISPEVAAMFKNNSGQRLIKMPYLKDQDVQVSTVPGFDKIPLNLGESGSYYFTAYDVFSGFRFYPASFANNVLSADWYKSQMLRNIDMKMAETIDEICGQVFEARKTQVLDYTNQISQGAGTYSFAASTLTISKAAQQETMFYNLQQLMAANHLGGSYRMVTSPAGLVATNVAAQMYGAANDKNIGWASQFMTGDRRYISDQIAVSGSENFNGFLLRDGAIGLYENFPWDFANGTRIGTKEFTVSDVALPYSKMRVNVYTNAEPTEAESFVKPSGYTADSNLTMTHFEEMALWARFYVVYRVNDDLANRANDIVKIVGATA